MERRGGSPIHEGWKVDLDRFGMVGAAGSVALQKKLHRTRNLMQKKKGVDALQHSPQMQMQV